VQLFFVISGFLITGILIDSEGKPGRWCNFIMRRVLRIFPLYFGLLAFFHLLLPALTWQLLEAPFLRLKRRFQ